MGFFGFYASPRGDNSLEAVEAAVQKQIDKLLADGISQDELDRARKSYLKTLVYSQDSQVALARIFGSILSTGGSIDDFVGWPDRLAAVSVEDVNTAARKYLDNSRAVTSYLLPKAFEMRMITKAAFLTFIAFLMLLLSRAHVLAVEITKVESRSGVTALLVEDYTLPIISLAFSFKGGISQDPEGKTGTVRLMTAMMNEGAGEYDSAGFREKLEELGVEMGFSSSRDFVVGSLRTVRSDRDEAFEMLRLTMSELRFDEEPMERMRDAIRTGIEGSLKSPGAAMSKALREALFAGHPYSKPVSGDLKSIDTIKREDLISMHKNLYARDVLTIGVVGAISKEELEQALDTIFGELPQTAQLTPVKDIEPTLGETVYVEMPVPKSSISLVYKGLDRDHPDFFAAHLFNHVLGGGTFSSRLYSELREKRGLVYGVSSGLATLENAAYFSAGTSTRVDNQEKAIEVIKQEIQKLVDEGVTEAELEAAKKYVIGAYAISNLDTSGKIARVLVAIQNQNLGIDYINRRRELIERVSLEDVNRWPVNCCR